MLVRATATGMVAVVTTEVVDIMVVIRTIVLVTTILPTMGLIATGVLHTDSGTTDVVAGVAGKPRFISVLGLCARGGFFYSSCKLWKIGALYF